MVEVRTIHEGGELVREVESDRYSTVHRFLVLGEMQGEDPEYEYQGEGEPPEYAQEAINEFEENADREPPF